MTCYGGYMGRVLKINLNEQKTEEYKIDDRDRKLYLGGKIMAAKIIYDNIKTKIDPMSEENILVITTGPLTGTGAPSSSRFNISSISPQTGYIASSNCGGNFGLLLKKSGYDGIIIVGKSQSHIWIEITEEEILFHNADDLWGKTTSETQASIGGKSGKIVIGPAGENLVKYAGIFSGERTAGRTGMGTVMGSKNIKAITAYGVRTVEIKNKEKAKNINKKWIEILKSHPITGEQLPKMGTAGILSSMNVRHLLATKNYKYGQFDKYENISGEYLREKYLVKNKGCISCPIQCTRIVNVNGKDVKGPEVETLGLLGSNLENGSLESILKWNHELDELGMDTISTGGTIGFAMELNEKGLWKNGLEFGKIDNLSQVFEDIAYRRGIGNLLAEGTKFLSQKFGGEDFAIHSKGLELAAYEPRAAVGQGLGYAVSNRGGCHINGGYMVILEGLGLNTDPYTIGGKAELTVMFQDLMEAVSAGGNCIFTTYAMLPKFLISKPNSIVSRLINKLVPYSGNIVNLAHKYPNIFLRVNIPSLFPYAASVEAVTGINMNIGKYKRIGERGYNLERLINLRFGLNATDDDLPNRLKNEMQIDGKPYTKVPIDLLKNKYYKVRGWSKDGIPTDKLKEKLFV